VGAKVSRCMRHELAASFNSKTVEKSDQIHEGAVARSRSVAGATTMRRGNVNLTGEQKEIPWDSWTR
jgi:hypothetical protein